MTDKPTPLMPPAAESGVADPASVTAACVAFITAGAAAPAEARRIGRRCLLDTLGLYLAGLHEPSTRILIGLAREDGGAAQARLLAGGGLRVPASTAARVLGTSAHAHDFDDTQVSHDPAHVYGLLTHPSVPPLTAALVLADEANETAQTDRTDAGTAGARLMHAFLTGFEVECKISEWLSADHYLRGHHSSGTVGTFGATAAAACMLGLDADQTRHALGIAASFAAGIRCNFGTMTKPLHVGRAAENGVLAARLAARGYTADPAALDGRWGFPAVLAGGFTPGKPEAGFGRTWTIVDPGVSIKPYPSGILTHQTMDAARALVIEADIRPETIERIDLYAGDNILNPIRYPIAANGLQAKFSLPALVAMIALYRDATIHEFDDAIITSAPFQAMQRRITTHRDEAINAQGFDLIRSRVRITRTDGRVFERDADVRYRGGPLKPMTDDELIMKFDGCARGLVSAECRALLIALLDPARPLDVATILDTLADAPLPVA